MYACKGVFNPNIPIFPPNSAEGLHFSAFHYLGIAFSRNGACDMHIKTFLDNGRRRVIQLHKVISNRNINLSARRHLLLSVIRPSIEENRKYIF